jgi:hypothetical protein
MSSSKPPVRLNPLPPNPTHEEKVAYVGRLASLQSGDEVEVTISRSIVHCMQPGTVSRPGCQGHGACRCTCAPCRGEARLVAAPPDLPNGRWLRPDTPARCQHHPRGQLCNDRAALVVYRTGPAFDYFCRSCSSLPLLADGKTPLQHAQEAKRPAVVVRPAPLNTPAAYAAKMTALCLTFPCLRGMPGVSPWRPEVLARRVGTMSSGEQAAAQFVLGVWSGGSYPRIAPFDLIKAMRAWGDDREHVAAVRAFMAEPFWP